MAVQDGNLTGNYSCVICGHDVDKSIQILQVIFGVALVLVNLLTLISLIKCRAMRKTNTIRLSLINLCITDIFMGFVFIYHYSVVYDFLHNAVECRIRYTFVALLSGTTLTTVMFLSLERIVAINFPFKYSEIMTTQTIYVAIAISWLCPAVVVTGAMPYMQPLLECNFLFSTDRKADIIFTSLNLAELFITMTCHLLIYRGAREQIAKIIPTFMAEDRAREEHKMKMKLSMTTTIILLPYLLCTTPMYVLFAILAAKPDLKDQLSTLYLFNSLYNLSAITSLLNPIVYAWKLPELRQTFTNLVKCC